MKLLLVALILVIGALTPARAQSLDEAYVKIYALIQEGDKLLAAGQAAAAVPSYTEAETKLKQFKAENPTWNEKVVAFRLRYLADRLQQARKGETIPARAPRPAVASPAPAPTVAPTPTPTPTTAPTQPAPAAVATDPRALTGPLERQIRQLEVEKASLEAKLREALTARPADTDPREMAKAQEQIRILQKENEILKVSLGQEKERSARAADPAMVEQIRSALADSNRKLSEQADVILTLRTENSLLKTQMQTSPDLARLRTENTTLATENQALKTEVGSLQKEIATLKPQLTAAAADLAKQMADARTQFAAQQKRIDDLTLERAELERRARAVPVPAPVVVASVPAPTPAAAPAKASDLEKRVAVLETELSESRKLMLAAAEQLQQLQKEKSTLVTQVAEYALQAAMAKPAAAASTAAAPAGRSTAPALTPAPAPDLELLRARIASLEAKPIPYTAEELALFQVAAPARPTDAARAVSTRVLPSGAATLVSQAQRAFNERRMAEAEQLYQQAVKLDTRNAYMLANLASTQIEQGRYAEAEANLKSALESAPDDAFALQLCGISQFRQGQFDGALNHLSRAAQLDPSNAETQNYLGVAFGQKGQRAPAETALRKAVQLSPGYASAHHNLAVVYATAQPPAVELARYHYGKARAAGHPTNADLEKLLGTKAAAN